MRFGGVILLFVFCVLAGCARSAIKAPEQAMRLSKIMPDLQDDLEFESLIKGLEANIRYLRTTSAPRSEFLFGPVRLSAEEYLRSLEYLLAVAKEDLSGERFRQALRENFEAHEVYGRDRWGEIFMTSYFEPVIQGSKTPTETFSQALYAVPKDLVMIDMGAFAATFPSLASEGGKVREQRTRQNVLRGRLLPADGATGVPRVVPFPDRKAIDSDGALRGQELEIVWVDPIDAFFLQIQGSGVVKLQDGSELRLGYAAQNGHPYVAIGSHLFNVIPKEKMSLQTLEAYLHSLSRAEAQRILNLNPSYVFFQKLENAGKTFLGTEVVAGRTVATDQTYFPKGALALLQFDRPQFASATAPEPASWLRSSRFVLDQDTGGAIRGPDRLDLFWGRGAEAKQAAGVIKNKGRLYYFVPKTTFRRQLMIQQ